jgi:hypothetical protein
MTSLFSHCEVSVSVTMTSPGSSGFTAEIGAINSPTPKSCPRCVCAAATWLDASDSAMRAAPPPIATASSTSQSTVFLGTVTVAFAPVIDVWDMVKNLVKTGGFTLDSPQ